MTAETSTVSMATEPATIFAPAVATERISSIDLLRGVALLGIAIMNIVFSALLMAADWNPKLAGGFTGPNLVAFLLQYICSPENARAVPDDVRRQHVSADSQVGRQGRRLEIGRDFVPADSVAMLFGIVHAYPMCIGTSFVLTRCWA